MTLDQIIAEIRRRMDAEGLSQAEVARRARTHQPDVSAYLAGRKHPSSDMLVRLAAAVGARVELVDEG